MLKCGSIAAVFGLDHDRCYRAVQARDPRFDGRFFTGVRSTGIYCRPICPARCPGSKQCVFFSCSAAAQDAGYRACRRCRPESAPGTPAWNGSSTTVARALSLITRGALDGVGSVDELSDTLGVSARHLRRLFTQHLGTSPVSVAQARRVEFAKELVDHSTLPITRVAAAAGFSSISRFNTAFKKAFHCSARESRAREGAPSVADRGIRLRLAYREPYDWDAMLSFFAARAIPGVEAVLGQGYYRSIAVGERVGCVGVTRAENRSALVVEIPNELIEYSLPIAERVRTIFDLRADPNALASHLGCQRAIGHLARRYPGVRVPGVWQLFELAVRALLGQHISVKAATTLSGRLVTRYGEPIVGADEGLSAAEAAQALPTHLFPTPGRLLRARVEHIGLPLARAQSLRDLSRAFADGRIDANANQQELQETLRCIKGIGPWTAAYVAMRSGGEPDALPAGDLVLRKSASRLLGRPLSESELGKEAQKWTPWRSYAAMLLWRDQAEQDRADDQTQEAANDAK